MALEIQNVNLADNSGDLIYDLSATFQPGLNVLVGPTLAGKTTLMRLMAGLITPDEGHVILNGQDVTKESVRNRSVSFVYQQFINYPAMTVFDNIASPLKVSKEKPSKDAIKARVEELAELLGLTPLLSRKPDQLSGGQQQRVAIARALARKSDLVLLDEPLANLDYKLREQLRDELQRIFRDADNIVIYSTAEPAEALDFGAETYVMSEGRLVQHGNALSLYHEPHTVEVAKVLSDPPINLLKAHWEAGKCSVAGSSFAFDNAGRGERADFTVGIQPHRLTLERTSKSDIELVGTVQLAEVTGSLTYVHLDLGTGEYAVVELDGAHQIEPDVSISAFFDTRNLFGFDSDTGETLFVAQRGVK